ncbi:MerR family transcriptional regulator [Yeosuana marina]|uniref:MerR family transcriptional regulator n=1 Tax=Yeosuana marina TaxID=1565536 RepID=UPI0030ED7CFB|tara:strand:- start:4575 stop:5486 length:912 start_codon:yes stop_codon:yes gene_type:complete
MNNIKTEFSIKDLENLSGIKAHTIRIWEKRYNLLHPKRTETNIRYYSTESLQKILNVSFLNNNGYKISKISNLKEADISSLVKEVAAKEKKLDDNSINDFKLAMLTFDQQLFSKTYKELIKVKSFKEIFYETFIPFLGEIGLLWQTDTITPAHEHFISTRIKQKILLNIEKAQSLNNDVDNKKTFVFFLPENEIHDIGLLFINYELISNGYQTIFLGQSIPTTSLKDLLEFYKEIIFITFMTVKPEQEDLKNYLEQFQETLLKGNKNELWILGNMLKYLDLNSLPNHITGFTSIETLVNNLKS